jgi:hypothetical protein
VLPPPPTPPPATTKDVRETGPLAKEFIIKFPGEVKI